jgi:TRAP-type C4-dicarboxylate transport system permease small subunit
MVDEKRDDQGQEDQVAPPPAGDSDDGRSNAGSNEDMSTRGAPEGKTPGGKAPAAWGNPVHRFSEAWTRLEIRLCAAVLIAEIVALCAWVLLKGLAEPPGSDSPAGVIVRAAVGAIVLGLGTYWVVRKRNPMLIRYATAGAILIGLLTAKAWDGVGSVYFSNLLNWMQDASTLTLIGGLRGLGTRLTVWLAMLGGSLAAASGKHIHIDVVRRFLPERLRMPTTMLAWSAAAAVCFTAAWGFTDHIAIGSYHIDRDAPASEKAAAIGHHASLGFFVLRKQVALDASTIPVVVAGKPYDSWLTNEMWNERVKDAGWEKHFTQEEVDSLQMPPETASQKRLPVVVVPGSTHTGLLVHLLNLVFPFGFIVIGLRFLLRALLAVSGHVKEDEVDLPEAHAPEQKGAEG